ncbi:MAG: hypothetical protein K8S94_10155 [Planctomycetia bacterium]|nr:hypothetical protein [Planctomycetia bacterium]
MLTLHAPRLLASTLLFFGIACVATADDGVAVASSASASLQAPAASADAIVGDWRPADMNVDVRIFASNGQYLGGIVKADNPEMVNKEMLRGITFDPNTSTWKGEVFAMKRGAFVPMTIRMTPAGFEMVAGSGIMSKTINWVRVQ